MTHNSYLGSSSHLNENVVNDLAFISGEEENIAQPPQQQIQISDATETSNKKRKSVVLGNA